MSTATPSRPAARVRYPAWLMLAIAIASFGAGIGVATMGPSTSAVSAVNLQAFDAVKFRAEERGIGNPAATFDAVQFRAEERQR